MNCNKLYYLSLSKIPKKFIDKETKCTTWDEETVFLVNSKYKPMIFNLSENKWIDHEFSESPFLD